MKSQTPLEETFGLPPIDEVNSTIEELNDDNPVENDDDDYDYDNAITHSHGSAPDVISSGELTDYKDRMDTIHQTALDKFNELMDVVLNCEPAQGAKFAGAATKLLEIAKNSQNEMIDRYMKVEELHMKRQKHDKEMKGLVAPPKSINPDGTPSDDNEGDLGDGYAMYDRNQLLGR